MSITVDQTEIQAFSKDADKWWDESGPFAPLHRLNQVRMGYIRRQICNHYGLNQTSLKPFTSLKVLDIGCGGGLACEPMARLGADVTGVDADPVAISVAQEHAPLSGLDITYKNDSAEKLKESFDVVLALEIIEHVSDPAAFVNHCARLTKPGGMVIFSTLNRTAKSYALGIVAAEYILGWVPKGTHTWQKFIKPAELSRMTRQNGLATKDMTGLVFSPLKNEFRISVNDLDVNYFLTANKA
ncbi:MAG: bifunctional 2-polyprenyl-6-hydroxyphenol methylase/3-demethylubiquinol 3-O-methyltransferase UbiG [Alphaproteobacteria bacterium]|nr:bifunctional 2-polyprenyl-6-hydroxyphenol methylase/3-demethylubiquinol 3-O-methyltransferase UbiG [Alphaproteobacteria bacterium]MCD8526390.1 bifunctional 2-polyprenyl-6-hydroxyphenol methylase/3-demethylubiquinol 3-O-methyltransferase UbiG [Alphaproteobacteria bacterium]MCD8571535.1 bifunctional 2-polyprenyl-6-hydroxyphenol methylase/3-demethylubiquinol 3-O-methyltransferase UbiG [Alphaproteobacteria bacterium]